MSWKSYLFPQTVLITSSQYNNHIRVNEEWGRMKLLVNGSPQSGAYIEKLWKSVFRHFSIQSHKADSALILGIGGGTIIHLLSEYFPGIKQTCVDIDNVIIDIARKYFSIESIKNITVIHADAQMYVKQLATKRKAYDCIIIDLSCGRIIPSFVQDKQFLKKIHSLLTPSGFLCLNYLREREYKIKSDRLYTLLRSLFPLVKDFAIENNRFFFCKQG